MRKRAHERDGYSDEDEPVSKEPKIINPSPSMTDRGHINFFADVKQGVSGDLSLHKLYASLDVYNSVF